MRERWAFAAVRDVVIAGRPALVALLSRADHEGAPVVRVYGDAGRVLGTWRFPYDHAFVDPQACLRVTGDAGAAYAVVRGRGDDYTVLRLTAQGPQEHGRFHPEEAVFTLSPGRLGARAAVWTSDGGQVRVRDLSTSAGVGTPWTPPAGWEVGTLTGAGDDVFALLHPVGAPGGAAAPDDWRHWLWSLTGRRPLGGPRRLRGYRWGPWPLGGRPVLVVMMDWRRLQAWDLARGDALGPPLPAGAGGPGGSAGPTVGVLHGRPVAAVPAPAGIAVWDLTTAEHLGTEPADDRVLALAVVAPDTVHAVTAHGTVTTVRLPARAVHPSARRNRRIHDRRPGTRH